MTPIRICRTHGSEVENGSAWCYEARAEFQVARAASGSKPRSGFTRAQKGEADTP